VNILYIASGIPVPGTLGGSTHTIEVARGLAARGHHVHVVAAGDERRTALLDLARLRTSALDGFLLHQIDIPKLGALASLPVIMRLARAMRPDIIMERYYNFAGCGLLAARRQRLPSILEVNALIVDPPQVRKRRIDDALGGPLRRWALAQCRMADRIVTPLHTTIPAEIARDKIVELPWGAAVERFAIRPAAVQLATLAQPGPGESLSQRPMVVFLGSFRAWHGVLDFVRAAGMLADQQIDAQFVLVGDGPLRAEAERLAERWPGRFTFTGAVPYERVPAILSQAVIGVAPFNTAPHPALRAAGFFWSPLKVYEYMAAGLPVVTANIAPLNQVVRDGLEGVLFHEGDVAGLAAAIGWLLGHAVAAAAMGERARARVTASYSWAHHCAELERIMLELRAECRTV
jgi:glycosyltransferase involved in cell wall biosynthesis